MTDVAHEEVGFHPEHESTGVDNRKLGMWLFLAAMIGWGIEPLEDEHHTDEHDAEHADTPDDPVTTDTEPTEAD